MAVESPRASESISFGEDFELDLKTYKLRRAGRLVKLERIPLEILLLLLEHKGQLVSREQIVERIWGKGVFLDTDNSINGAIRKIRQVLRDNPEQPDFVQTVTGRGYRFIASVVESCEGKSVTVATPQTAVVDGRSTQESAEGRWWWVLVATATVVALAPVACAVLDLYRFVRGLAG